MSRVIYLNPCGFARMVLILPGSLTVTLYHPGQGGGASLRGMGSTPIKRLYYETNNLHCFDAVERADGRLYGGGDLDRAGHPIRQADGIGLHRGPVGEYLNRDWWPCGDTGR